MYLFLLLFGLIAIVMFRRTDRLLTLLAAVALRKKGLCRRSITMLRTTKSLEEMTIPEMAVDGVREELAAMCQKVG